MRISPRNADLSNARRRAVSALTAVEKGLPWIWFRESIKMKKSSVEIDSQGFSGRPTDPAPCGCMAGRQTAQFRVGESSLLFPSARSSRYAARRIPLPNEAASAAKSRFQTPILNEEPGA